MIILDGRKIAKQILKNLKEEIDIFARPPGLAFILVGNNPSSETYIRTKKRRCQDIGILSKDQRFPEDVTEKVILAHIHQLNQDASIDGILIQQPLPPHLCVSTILESVAPHKDVDGFHPLNMGRLLLGEDRGFIPCTPQGIHHLLLSYEICLEKKHVVIVGRSNIVGKPLAALLVQKKPQANATVTVTHSMTQNLKELTASADILVAAIGSPHFIQPSMVRQGAVVIDVGINRVGQDLLGDVDFKRVAPLASFITPVPGGIGPMTVAMLLSNTVKSFKQSLFK